MEAIKQYQKSLKSIMKSKIKDKYLKKLGIVHAVDAHVLEEVKNNIEMSKYIIR